MSNNVKFAVTSNVEDIDNLTNVVPLSFNEDKDKLFGFAKTITDTIHKPEYTRYIYADIKYRMCFTNRADFRGKRFLKFAKKVEDRLYNVLSSITQDDIRGKITLEDFITYSVFYDIGFDLEDIELKYYPTDYDLDADNYISYPEEKSYIKTISKDIMDLIHRIKKAKKDNPDVEETAEIIRLLKSKGLYRLSDEELISVIREFSIKRCYEHTKKKVYPALYNLIEEHLRSIYVFDEDACEANYHQYLPDEEEVFGIFVELMTRIYIDASNYISTHWLNNCVAYQTQKIYLETFQSYIDNAAEKDAEIEELQEEITRLKNTNSFKKEISTASTDTNDTINKLKEELRLSRKENDKLNKKLAEYESKYEDIRQMLDILQKKNTPDTKEETYDIDTEKRYVFAMDNWTSYRQEIKAVFPNAEFVGENTNLEPKKIDLVILMPGHLGHPTYYSIKKQCKDKGINFVHCNKTNMDEIKKVIALSDRN